MRKLSHHMYEGKIIAISGVRVGGGEERLAIMDVDNPYIRDPVTSKPYLPGTSLKGRMRSLIERVWGFLDGENPAGPTVIWNGAEYENPIARVFGTSGDTDASFGPSRIKVYDAPCLKEAGPREKKPQNVVGRKNNTAINFFEFERVAPGGEFLFRVDLQYFDSDERFSYSRDEFPPPANAPRGLAALEEVVLHGIDLLKENGIGSGTSKGYGRIDIVDLRILPKPPRSMFPKDGR